MRYAISIQSYPHKYHGYSRSPPLFPLSIKLWDSSFQSLESEHRECWLSRNKRILDQLLHLESSIVCLQVLLLRSVFIWAQEDVCEQYMLENLHMPTWVKMFRNFGWATKNLWTCMRRDLAMLDMQLTNLHVQITVVMVQFIYIDILHCCMIFMFCTSCFFASWENCTCFLYCY